MAPFLVANKHTKLFLANFVKYDPNKFKSTEVGLINAVQMIFGLSAIPISRAGFN